MIKIAIRGMSLILGAVFLVSGWLKGVDPFGASLKINEYVGLFQLHFLEDMGMVLAVLLCALELVVGLLLLFGVHISPTPRTITMVATNGNVSGVGF